MWIIRIWKNIRRIQGDTVCEGKLYGIIKMKVAIIDSLHYSIKRQQNLFLNQYFICLTIPMGWNTEGTQHTFPKPMKEGRQFPDVISSSLSKCLANFIHSFNKEKMNVRS